MTKGLGFLTGVFLTLGVFVLAINRWEHLQPAEGSPSEIDGTIESTYAASNAIDQASVNLEHTPNDTGQVTASDDSDTPGAPTDDTLQPARSEISSGVSLSLPTVTNDVEIPDHVARPLSSDQTATAGTRKTEVAAEDIDSLALDQDRTRFGGHSDATRSHVFWSPFRSEWAADGFARRLTEATQINIDVIEVQRGRYRAVFSYQDESQRLEHMDRIESITGLKPE